MSDKETDAQVEELEPLELIEEVEELEEISSPTGLLGKAIGLSGDAPEPVKPAGIVVPHVPLEINPFMSSVFPVLFVDRQLRIICTNPACDSLFTGFFNIAGNYFFDIFGKYFKVPDIKQIRETIVDGKNGYSWKGESRIKSHDLATVQTKVYIFPGEIVKEPTEFVVMFDDVTEENKRLLRSVFLSLLEASKLKDNDTGQHITRVNYYSKRLSEELYYSLSTQYPNIDADFIENIGFLASMHDVGKIGTPDDILNKEGPLSDWEWTVMREHTKNGAFILSTYPNPMAKEIALSHHERWDGGGYPFQLEGEMIPLAARIVSIADVYDALRMERSYKPALTHDVALSKMMEERGTHFDPFLVEVFHIISDEFNRIYEDNKDKH
ncbi:MAG: HD-GYP domain-containing protein [Treponema sp.]|jgi:putative two-component system response regulator|nr:HD-GYP domain-containing protein [Treponema sp.]